MFFKLYVRVVFVFSQPVPLFLLVWRRVWNANQILLVPWPGGSKISFCIATYEIFIINQIQRNLMTTTVVTQLQQSQSANDKSSASTFAILSAGLCLFEEKEHRVVWPEGSSYLEPRMLDDDQDLILLCCPTSYQTIKGTLCKSERATLSSQIVGWQYRTQCPESPYDFQCSHHLESMCWRKRYEDPKMHAS